MVTGHGKRSITGVELGIDVNSATQNQLQAIPGISSKGAWRLLSARARETGKFSSAEHAFNAAQLELPRYWGGNQL
tara:strand:- start:484 stop:711 length:228 start_codon:yes stop_codon:yes gene_type:complete